jgi:hypothetical protein
MSLCLDIRIFNMIPPCSYQMHLQTLHASFASSIFQKFIAPKLFSPFENLQVLLNYLNINNQFCYSIQAQQIFPLQLDNRLKFPASNSISKLLRSFLKFIAAAPKDHLKLKVHHVHLHFASLLRCSLHHLRHSINNSSFPLAHSTFLHENDYHNFVLVSNSRDGFCGRRKTGFFVR